jgi:hypothetical protein
VYPSRRYLRLVQRLVDVIVGVLMGGFVGMVPSRRPWRGVVLALYGVLALAGIGVVIWVIRATL